MPQTFEMIDDVCSGIVALLYTAWNTNMIICYINFTIFGNSKNKVQNYRILVFKQIRVIKNH